MCRVQLKYIYLHKKIPNANAPARVSGSSSKRIPSSFPILPFLLTSTVEHVIIHWKQHAGFYAARIPENYTLLGSSVSLGRRFDGHDVLIISF